MKVHVVERHYVTAYQILLWWSSKDNKMGKACGRHGRDEKCYGVFVGKPEGTSPLRMLRHRRNDITKMDHKEIGLDNVD